jgi:hypothetical protein
VSDDAPTRFDVKPDQLKALVQAYETTGRINSRALLAAFPGVAGPVPAAGKYSRFIRVGMDGLINLDQVAKVTIVEPPPAMCDRCGGKGSVIIAERRQACGVCHGKGTIAPPAEHSVVEFELVTGSRIPVRFDHVFDARTWFEMIATTTVIPFGTQLKEHRNAGEDV